MKRASSFFEPDRYFDCLSSIDVDRDVIGLGIKTVLLDIDNTIRSRADGGVPFDVSAWLQVARSKGVELCLLSNNWHADVYDFAQSIGIPIIAKACKPLPFAFVRALGLMGASKDEVLMVGDQLSTDVWGAHLLGIRAYLVLPLATADLRHTRYVRKIEARFLTGVALEGSSPEAAKVAERLHDACDPVSMPSVVRDSNNTCDG